MPPLSRGPLAIQEPLCDVSPIRQPQTKLPSTSTSCQSHCRVSFEENVVIQPSVSYTMEEAKATWYNSTELFKMHQDVNAVARRIQSWSVRPNDCLRGLEDRTTRGVMQLQRHRRCGLRAVLNEQSRQRQQQQGSLDQERICLAYSSFGCIPKCVELAQQLAVQDALEAQQYQQESLDETCSIEETMKEDTLANHGEENGFQCWIFTPWFAGKAKSSAVLAC